MRKFFVLLLVLGGLVVGGGLVGGCVTKVKSNPGRPIDVKVR